MGYKDCNPQEINQNEWILNLFLLKFYLYLLIITLAGKIGAFTTYVHIKAPALPKGCCKENLKSRKIFINIPLKT
jgi:hypothetical protein